MGDDDGDDSGRGDNDDGAKTHLGETLRVAPALMVNGDPHG
jgi:hypothetical protein